MKLWFVGAALIPLACVAQEVHKPQPGQVLSSESGRYVLGQLGQYESSTYLLDTKTGRVWQIVRYMTSEGKDGGNALAPVRYIVQGGQQTDEPPPARK